METLFAILNSNFGIVVSGALISGLFVQYIASSWQRRNWVFEQQFTADRTRSEKEMELKYKSLEDVNTAVATILAHSQFVVAGYVKHVPSEQMNREISRYNDAVLMWDTDFGLHSIRIRTLFENKEVWEKWMAIKAERDKLDVEVYEMTGESRSSPAASLALIDGISHLTCEMSRQMIAEINQVKR